MCCDVDNLFLVCDPADDLDVLLVFPYSSDATGPTLSMNPNLSVSRSSHHWLKVKSQRTAFCKVARVRKARQLRQTNRQFLRDS